VIFKGDNGRRQANYLSMLGGLAAGGISNLYYPPTDRGVDSRSKIRLLELAQLLRRIFFRNLGFAA
jgi:hypothetical protein